MFMVGDLKAKLVLSGSRQLDSLFECEKGIAIPAFIAEKYGYESH